MDAQKISAGLGWFSLGLGLYETAAPGHLAEVLGIKGSEGLLRFYGLREIGAGVGIYSTQPRPLFWMWGRVAGDALDITTLSLALAKPDNPKKANVWIALGAVLGVTALDILCVLKLSKPIE